MKNNKKCKECGTDLIRGTKFCSKICKRREFYKKISLICTGCEEEKPISEYYYPQIKCKGCVKERAIMYQQGRKKIDALNDDLFIKVGEFLMELKWVKRFYVGKSDMFKIISLYIDIFENKHKGIEGDIEELTNDILNWWLMMKNKHKKRYTIMSIMLENKYLKKKELNKNYIRWKKCTKCLLVQAPEEYRKIERKNKTIQILKYCKSCERKDNKRRRRNGRKR
jgi:hypothetical protein